MQHRAGKGATLQLAERPWELTPTILSGVVRLRSRGPGGMSVILAAGAGPGQGRGREGIHGVHFWKGRNTPAIFKDNTFSINNPKRIADKLLELIRKLIKVTRAIYKIHDQS